MEQREGPVDPGDPAQADFPILFMYRGFGFIQPVQPAADNEDCCAILNRSVCCNHSGIMNLADDGNVSPMTFLSVFIEFSVSQDVFCHVSDLQEGEGSVVEATTGQINAADAVSNESSESS